MKLSDLEIDRVDWDGLLCGCGGPATHVAEEIRRLIGEGESSGVGAGDFEGHLYFPSVLYEPAVPVISVIFAALAEGAPVPTRMILLELLYYISDGEGQDSAEKLRDRDIPEECCEATKTGLWPLYAEIVARHSRRISSWMFEIVEEIDEDRERLEFVRAAMGDFLWERFRSPKG